MHLTQSDEVEDDGRSLRGAEEGMIPYAREVEEDDHKIPESESPFRVKVPRSRELELADASTKVG